MRSPAAGTTRRWSRGLLRRGGPLGAILALSVVLSGCLSSGYTYLQHQSPDGTVLYFKVPSSWSRFTFSADEKATNGQLSISQISQIEGARWQVSFDAAPKAKPSVFLDNLSARYPQGIVFAAELSPDTRDSFSLAAMRSEVLGVDPLAVPTTESPAFTILDYNEFTLKGGIRGSKLITDIGDTGGITDTYAQIVDVDPTTDWVFGLAVACRASCWGPNASSINQILNTWNVKELRP